jgi:hypothetical protein
MMSNKLSKTMIIGAAAALAVPFSAVIIAAPASAVPCPDDGGAMEQSCMDCVTAAGMDMNAQRACHGFAPVIQSSTGYADCDAYSLPENRANCLDQHLMGQR